MNLGLVAQILQIVADSVTILLGGGALFALIFKRKKLEFFLNAIMNSHFNDRVRRIRETITQLDNISFEVKEQYKEGLALLGSLSGQIKPLSKSKPALHSIHADIVVLLEGKIKVKESRKRAVIAELSAIIDDLAHIEYLGVVKGRDDE